MLVRYDVAEPDVLRVQGLDEKVVEQDVRSGVVPGTVTPPPPDAPKEPPTITLTAETDALRAYLRTGEARIWKSTPPLVLRRVAVR